ncbi:MAG: TonB family protein [Ottowia sp.]|uniref:energy transducer TonB n=1 Tax=Ottowia sp. TaxID=1898956 RepID=UPI0039E657A1
MHLPRRRDTLIIAIVALAHVLALWMLHKASRGKPPKAYIPATLLAEIITLAPPAASESPDPLPQMRPAPAPEPRSQPAAPTLAVADAPLKALTPVRPSPRSAPPAPDAAHIVPVTPQSEPSPPTPQMPEILVRPSGQPSDSINPAPLYPATSRHLREAGRVVVRVLIGPDGRPIEVVLQRSSGFDRLDQVSLETVRSWRFDTTAYLGAGDMRRVYVPITFVLE